MPLRTITSIIAILLITNPLSAKEMVLETGTSQNYMIELYTSEGCSSCPPAEHFLNEFKNKADLWDRVIPMAFHVDYWDYIGWKDRFAQAVFSRRQHGYAQLQRRSTVYTPAFFINGINWRPGFFFKRLPTNNQKKIGSLKVTLKENTITARFNPLKKKAALYNLNIALLGTGITTHIKAGENKGRKSTHEFVVLNHQKYRSHNLKWKVNWSPLTQQIKSLSVSDYAIAAWINTENNLSPIQATGGYLPDYFLKKQ